jgi:TetR/AcrR family transcriptional regulator, transcriptional repressor for nem operon
MSVIAPAAVHPASAPRARDATRARLLAVGGELFNTQGYNHTGINAIVQAAGVPKGSFYYYFASKEDFGLAVIDQVAAHYDARLRQALEAPALSPLARLRAYFEQAQQEMRAADFAAGCLIGNLGQELAGRHPAFRARLDEVFCGWVGRFAACLRDAQRQGDIDAHADAAQLAEFLLAGWEGALLRAKVTHSAAPLQAFVSLFFSRVLRAT